MGEITKDARVPPPSRHAPDSPGVCLDAGPGVSMVMAYMINGSLLDYLKKERSTLELAEGQDSEKVF